MNNKLEIQIDGKTHVLYVDKAKRAGALTQKTYGTIGQRFNHNGDVYILAKTNMDDVALIDLDTGNRWTDSVEVLNSCEITKEEWEEITDGQKFTLIEN